LSLRRSEIRNHEIKGKVGAALNRHCSMCRKATGAAFRSRVAVARENFRWVTGEDLLTYYDSSPNDDTNLLQSVRLYFR
jgi:hypothetical protein